MMHIDLDENEDLLPHYDLDYSKARPNRFAEAYKKGVTINPETSDDDQEPEFELSRLKLRRVGQGRKLLNTVDADPTKNDVRTSEPVEESDITSK
jgi:hypothetical protein